MVEFIWVVQLEKGEFNSDMITFSKNVDHNFILFSQLDDACRFVAHFIGDDWKSLYVKLPFIPPRDRDRIRKDVEVIDNISVRRDSTPEESALKSLEKWRSFNRKGNVVQLIKGLRQVNKVDLAQKLETRYNIEDLLIVKIFRKKIQYLIYKSKDKRMELRKQHFTTGFLSLEAAM
ncbi:hypothetical protein KUTeg_021758, partial [Tegillarca granosa]